ncbi:calcium/calmodulin-dependent/calcium-dependent protein kinase, partial [Kipferlia bialata]|eukprot:g10179.t1
MDAEYLKQYVLAHELGTGSFGKVMYGIDRESGDEVAIKTMRLTNETADMVSGREVKVMSRLRHPNVIRLHKVITTPFGIHLVMELADGTLSQCKERITPVSYHVYCRPVPIENL